MMHGFFLAYDKNHHTKMLISKTLEKFSKKTKKNLVVTKNYYNFVAIFEFNL